MSLEAPHNLAFSLSDHLPILQVLIPFIAAPLAVVIGNRIIAWWLAFISSVISLLIATTLLGKVIDGSVISYQIGGWAPPLGIEYRVDSLSALILFLVTLVSTIILPYAYKSINFEIPKEQHTLFYAAYLLCLTGLLGVAVTGDAFNVFVFLEISSLSTYVLIAQGSYRDKRALTAAFDYLIMGTIGATFFVIGIGFLYMATGTLNMVDMSNLIKGQESLSTVRSGFVFIVIGIGLKLAIFPLHFWLPRAYTYAPSAITAFLAATATKVAVYMLLRFMFTIFHPNFLSKISIFEYIILPLAIMAMFSASVIAVFQSDFKKLLAYSSIAQIGYILLGIGLMSETSLTAAVIHIFNHGITKAVLFMGIGAYVLQGRGSFLSDLEGIGKVMPWTSAAIVVGFLSLIGVPGTVGFISKWFLVKSALEIGWWPVAIAIVLTSLLAVIYCWRVIETIYFKPLLSKKLTAETPISMLLPIWVGALACIYFGLNTEAIMTTSQMAAKSLYAGSFGSL
ncbi:MAG: monovalent cation/H+ antiporter subunit D family protein [Proteobacteria bacterium]|jgi:multicomponent Na+:H+ antiporter subunit D|nr:monovalent cation/H+ antiporter subunit D family protein [Pseudomonadota bacterium]